MKNLIIGLLLIVSVIAGYFAVKSRLRLSLEGIEGKTAKLIRGDLTLPINATGEIRSVRRAEVKSEASGEVLEIARQAGDRIKAGDLLIRLQPDDEQRSVNRAQLDRDKAEARRNTSEITLEQARTVDRDKAAAQVVRLEASLELAQFQINKYATLPEIQRTQEETLQRETTVRSQKAQLDSALADLKLVDLQVARAQQELRHAQAEFETVESNLADARKRLAKTDIVAPFDGIVGDVRVQIGEVIQGGKTTFTGGTVLANALDIDRLLVRAEVDEADIGRVLAIAPRWATPGNDGTVPLPRSADGYRSASDNLPKITVESFRDREFTGGIQRIYPEPKVLQNVVTYLVDILILDEDHKDLLPGMRADVNFTSEHVKNAVLCPNEAIRDGPRGGLGVYIPKPDSPKDQRETLFVSCTFGLDNGNYSQVLCSELQEGVAVYTKLPAKREDERKSQKDRKKAARKDADS